MKRRTITDEEIAVAKMRATYTHSDPRHEHNDCIRIAYEWLDAQLLIKSHQKTGMDLKHLIENWAGRYISTSDVEVAAHLHDDINGTYPHYNISSRLTEPSIERLVGITEAYKHSKREYHKADYYRFVEEGLGKRTPRKPF